MNLVRQFMLLFLMLFLGDLTARTLGIPVPGNILGMLLLTVALMLGALKLKDVEEAGKLLLDHLPIFFIPSSVGIMLYFDLIRSQIAGILVPTILSIMIGLYVAGKVVDYFVKEYEEDVNA
ncbi:holin-like protein [Geosporobacter subterraneus DSM 17957]|uniref:Holin-like protein n=1 Tax=Geosporobacter subterraneus DSM 17957 TaxID=1121919 RepID=A0A1M6QNA1_9FIRM|nr:CidA/LrgA family protein [Geosporobacter subterraneus]SHK21721.1 holin-like protein [Geosporobacter subterraneus DSM 17957]